jgi:hypothetical protein
LQSAAQRYTRLVPSLFLAGFNSTNPNEVKQMNKAEEPKEPKEPTYDELIQKISHKSWFGGMSMPTREEINALLAARWRERDEAERKLKASKQHED